MQKITTAIAFSTLLLITSGCIATIPYWKKVEKQQEENSELADQMEWQAREDEMKAKETEAADTPPPDKPFKPSDF